MNQTQPIVEFEPEAVADMLRAGSIVLIDVREPGEFAAGHIEGAMLVPLSRLDPRALPDAAGRSIIFQCGSGVRSANAVALCRAAGLPHNAHLRGGIRAWIGAGLPTV